MTTALVTAFASEHFEENVLPAIAHEIRQPLSAIESIAYYLLLTLSEDDKNREQVTRVQQLVEQSNWILSNGLGIADPRRPEPELVHLDELIHQAIAARPASMDPPLHCDLATELAPVHLDPMYGRSLIENVLGLFRQLASERIRSNCAPPRKRMASRSRCRPARRATVRWPACRLDPR
jgi:K+-sensing histidine kinase KdpD